MRCLLFLLLLVCANSFALTWATCDIRRMCVWPNNKLPVNFVMDNANIAGYRAPNNLVPNNAASRSYLVDQLKTWNGDGSFFIAGSLVGSISIGNVSPRPLEKNGINEITFFYWDEDLGDRIAAAYTYIHNSATQKTPYSPTTSIIIEADIYINPTRSFYIGSTPPSGCDAASNQQMNIETVLKHEMGHALGHARHSGSARIMRSLLRPCTSEDVTNNALKSISDVYPSKLNVDINIQSPTQNQILIINQPHTFTANITALSSRSLSAKEIKETKSAEDSLRWVSSIDGEIGVGNSISPLLLTGGEHDLTVTIGEPGDAIYGEEFSSYFVVDTTSDIVDPYGRTVAYPFPCVRSVARSDNACLFTVLDSVDTTPAYLDGCGYRPIGLSSSPPPYSEDYQPTGQSTKFDLHIEPFPRCNFGINGRKYYAFTSWVYDVITTNSVDFHLNYALKTRFQDRASTRNVWFYDMPLVDPEIYVDPPGDCDVANVTAKCGVDINWSDKYFLPEAGVFYKPNGSANWALAQILSEDNAGTINTGNIVGVGGGQIAIFQYSNDVTTPNYNGSIPNPGKLMIRAPSGMVAGPFTVYALMPPSGTLTANDTNCIIPLNKTKCSIAITLTKSDTPWACAWFADTKKLKVCTSSASRTFTSVDTTESCCDFVLKAHDIKPEADPRWDGGGSGSIEIFNEGLVLDALSVRGVPEIRATGALTSNSPCQLASGNTKCTVQLEYQKNDTPWACVWTVTNKIFACTAYDSLQIKDWIYTTVAAKTLELRAHLTRPISTLNDRLAGKLLDSASVYAQEGATSGASGSISAPDSPCTLPAGKRRCTVTLEYQKSDTPWACVWTATKRIFACTAYDSLQIKDWKFTTSAGMTLELRAHDSRPTSSLAGYQTGVYLDDVFVKAN